MELKEIISRQIRKCQADDKYIATILVKNIEHFDVTCLEVQNVLKESNIAFYNYRITKNEYVAEMYVSFDNDIVLRVLIPSANRRGWRTNCAIVDDVIPEKIRNELIYPKIINWQCEVRDQWRHRIILTTIE